MKGNKLADREAKKVVKGQILDTKLLSLYLRKCLPTNLIVVKAAHNKSLKSE